MFRSARRAASARLAISFFGVFFVSDMPKSNKKSIYYQLGRAIAAWHDVETELSLILRDALDATNGVATTAALSSVVNPNIRLSILNAAIRYSRKPGKMKQKWATLEKRIRKCAKRRNKLAHYRVLRDNPPYLSPGLYHLETTAVFVAGKDRPRITISDIKRCRKQFKALSANVRLFRREFERVESGAEHIFNDGSS